MKALSLWAPWGSLIARRMCPQKRFETRGWKPSTMPLRNLVIHQSAKWSTELRDLCFAPTFHEALGYPPRQLGPGSRDIRALLRWSENAALPHGGRITLGAALCVVDVIKVWTTEGLKEYAKRFEDGAAEAWFEEFRFGDYSPGRFAWEMDNVRILSEPVPLIGRQGLWELTNTESNLVRAAMKEVARAS